MSFAIRASSRDLGSVRQALRETNAKGLGQQMGRAFQRASKPLDKAVRAEVPKAMPSGYAPTLSKSLHFRTRVRSSRHSARVEWVIHAAGQKEKRDLPALNRGTLRHPVYGRRRQPWVAQRVRRGVVDRPVDRLAPDIRREMNAVVDWVASQITKG